MYVDTEVRTHAPSSSIIIQASKSSADKKRKRLEGSSEALSLPLVVTASKIAKKAGQATPTQATPSQ